jgi:hypothetical protein
VQIGNTNFCKSIFPKDLLGGMKQMKRILISLIFAFVILGCRQEAVEPTSNSLFVIVPYRHAGTWVFDDSGRGLSKEPFVAGIPELIDKLVADIPNADKGFRLTFSAQEFPGYDVKLVWKRKDASGNWYYSESFKAEGWLCSALFKYFKQAPKTIYVKAEAK